jgi:hypothetical protein
MHLTEMDINNATLLFNSSSVTLDNQLSLYVVNQNNYRIQKSQQYCNRIGCLFSFYWIVQC